MEGGARSRFARPPAVPCSASGLQPASRTTPRRRRHKYDERNGKGGRRASRVRTHHFDGHATDVGAHAPDVLPVALPLAPLELVVGPGRPVAHEDGREVEVLASGRAR